MPMPVELQVLMQRYCQLGRLLPPVDDADLQDPRSRAEIKVVIEEMDKVKAQIDDFLTAAACS
jgi:hypothetical protein